ncbi:MAG: dTMP kinase [Pirellulaceae bacterium]|jgi:dTMP kinase|nr:dTMP kinase [Pirellulaceae bacterium]
MSGLFLSLDGVDGAGKSTQVARLIAWFEQQGRTVISPRDPGSTALGEALREILLHRQEIPLSMTAEMLLYMASRAQLVREVIHPALAAGQVVIADRYLLANVVYQGCAGGETVEHIWQVGSIATGGLMPQLTFILDVPVEVALARLSRGLDRLESRGPEYMRLVRDGFLQQAQRLGDAAVIIDASQSPDEIHAAIISHLQ